MTDSWLTRRQLLVAGGGVALAGTGGAVLLGGRGGEAPDVPAVRADPGGRPKLQHRWDASLRRDGFGNRTAPRLNRLLHLRLESGRPTVAAAAALEDGLRAVEAMWPSGPAGLLILIGWGPSWFRAVGRPSPVPDGEPLTPDEAPAVDDHVACIHLASDDRTRIDQAERRLRRSIREPFAVVDRRSGFTGAGLPRGLGKGANGIPAGQPREDSPLFMGFASGHSRNQAPEPAITIDEGAWAGSTTMHVSVLSLALASWFGSLSEEQRAARMFAPQISLRQVRNPGDGIDPPGDVAGTARRNGLIGHAQAVGAARRGGVPRLLRRDFNGLDGDQPLVHFVSLQRSIEDFAETRRAMAASRAVAADERVQPHVNNGINEWVTTRRRANYIVPPRSRRSCPGLAGWDT